MTILTFLILSLAAYRLTHLIVFDKIFEPIRNLFVKRNVEFKMTRPIVLFQLQGGPLRKFIGRMINCFWCTGLWVSFAVALGFNLFPIVTYWISVALAMAAVSSLVETLWAKLVGFPEMMEVGDKHE